jgi:hypothetical protein
MFKRLTMAAAFMALAGFVLASPASAADEETNAVWNNLRPNLTPPFSGKSKKAWTGKYKSKSASGTDSRYVKPRQ